MHKLPGCVWEILFLVAVVALVPAARAQVTVSGRIVESDQSPVAFANVQLLVGADSSLARGTVADVAGQFEIESVSPGSYLLYVSLIGYEDHLSGILTLSGSGERRLEPIVLRQATVELQEVAVEGRRALYEQKGDRLVINVASSVTLAGATALQVLERSPGVIINRVSNSISMVGKSGVRLMINGKLSYLPADGLVDYLSGISADNVVSIELITSPPADLDAEGNAGYINLVLKESPDDGLNGSVTLSGGFGQGEIGNASTDVNFRRSRTSIYASYSFVLNGQNQFMSNYRRVVETGGITETPTETWRDPRRIIHNARLSVDYELDKKTTFGALVAAYDNRWTMTARNELTIRNDGVPMTFIGIDNDEINHWRHAMGNLNVRRKMGPGGTLSADVDYLYYHDDNPTDYTSQATHVASGQVEVDQLESDKLTPLNITVGKADYLLGTGRDWEFGVGAKGAFSRFTNNVSFAGLVQDQWLTDAGLDSKSTLREDVLAVYVKAEYAVEDAASLSLGLRYEWTESNLGSLEQKNLVDRRFGSLFPSLAYSHQINEAVRMGGSFTRRITRPSFSDMAPFLYFLDPYTFFSGNAGLQPAITNTAKLDFSYRSLLASIQYAWEDSSITRFQSRLIPGRNIQVMSPMNFRETRTVSLLLALPFEITGWWTTQNNLTVMFDEVDGFINGDPVALKQETLQFNGTQNVSLPRGLALEASGFYYSGGLFGAMKVEPIWMLNLGLQKTLPGNSGKLTFSVNDLFNTFRISGTTGTADDPLYIKQHLTFRERSFQLTYSRRFGGGKRTNERSTASEEESGRLGGEGM